MNSFATGDFNGDGKMDYAFGQDSSATITDTRAVGGSCPLVNDSRVCFAGNSVGSGRVFVWYGGASNGPAVQPDGSSGYPMVTEYSGLGGNDKFGFATLSNVTGQTSGTPCGESGGITCNRIQAIAESAVSGFGQTITSIPVGKCGLHPVSALAVRGINNSSSSSSIFLYLPKCLESGSSLSGLVTKGLNISSGVGPIVTSSSFGESLLGVGVDGIRKVMKSTSQTTSANGELVGHLIATDSREGMVYSLPLVKNLSGSIQFETLPSSAQYDKTASFFKLGGRINNYKGQDFLSPLSPSDGRFGFSSSFLGDLNADGYGDIGINIASVHRKENSSTYLYQGGILVLFGGASGLQTHRESTSLLVSPRRDSDSQCYLVKKSSLVSVCDPQLLFSPQPSLSHSSGQGAYEYMYLSPYSHLSTGANPTTGVCSVANSRNECLGSFIFGVPGRDSPPPTNNLSRILQGGVFYVQP
jgi:hypothetical protein